MANSAAGGVGFGAGPFQCFSYPCDLTVSSDMATVHRSRYWQWPYQRYFLMSIYLPVVYTKPLLESFPDLGFVSFMCQQTKDQRRARSLLLITCRK